MVDRRCIQEAQRAALMSDWHGRGVQDEARWAVMDTGRRRNGRKLLRSAGDTGDVRSPLASQWQSQGQRQETLELLIQGLKLTVQEDGNVPQDMCGRKRDPLFSPVLQPKGRNKQELSSL